MGFRQTENEFSSYTTSQIYWQLEHHGHQLTTSQRFVLCDQLLQRKQPITHISQRFEDIVHGLKRDVMLYIEKYDERFSKATVHLVVRKLQSLGRNVSRWFYMKEGTQLGPFNRLQIEQAVVDGKVEHLWKEGWPEWKGPEEFAYLTDELYYDQIFPQSSADSQQKPSFERLNPKFEATPSGSAISIVTGILVLIGLPVWIVSCVALPIVGHDTFTGWFLPLIASIFMLIATVPMGIGMLMRRVWAWNMTVFTSAIMLLWFVVLVVYKDVSSFWFVLSFYQAILLILALSARSAFKRSSADSFAT